MRGTADAKAGGGGGAQGRSLTFLRSFCLKHKQKEHLFFLEHRKGLGLPRMSFGDPWIESDETRFAMQTNLDFILASLGNSCVGGGDNFTSWASGSSFAQRKHSLIFSQSIVEMGNHYQQSNW